MSWLNGLASRLSGLIVPSGDSERHVAVVMDTRRVSPGIRRLSLGGPGVQRFIMDGGVGLPAAWVKLFVVAQGGLTIGRAYTIRRVDRALGRIDVDFVRHEHGPVSQWADQARVGDTLSLAGPRPGGFVLQEGTQWLVLIGDASALPAIEAILSSLPEPLRVTALVELPSAQDGRVMTSASMVRLHWVLAGERPGLVETVLSWGVPDDVGSCQVWLAGEAGLVTALRQHVLGTWLLPRERLYGKAYWRHGQADFRSRDDEGFQT